MYFFVVKNNEICYNKKETINKREKLENEQNTQQFINRKLNKNRMV